MTVECEKCGRSFDSEEALEQHMRDYTHSEKEDSGSLKERFMDSRLSGIAMAAGFLVLLGFIGTSVMSGPDLSRASGGDISISAEGEPFVGSENASVTIAYFGDYNCSSCLMFEQRTFPSLKQEVVGDDVRFVKKNFPVINHQSPELARASQSVWEQTKDSNPEAFWEWHAVMYDNQGGYGSDWATNDRIVELSGQVEGVDAEKVRKDLEDDSFSSEVQEDRTEGSQSGVRGTPTFIIYSDETGKSRTLVGPQPVSEFKDAVRKVQS
jgi:protein-disulfide isomerase